jgi:hypothetical protein
MRIVLIVLSLLACSIVFSQDSSWHRVRVNEDLVLSLPGKITKMDTVIKNSTGERRMFIYSAKGKYSTLGITVTPNKTNMGVDDKESHKKNLDIMAEGARKGGMMMGYICKSSTTVVDSIEGIKMLMYTSDTSSEPLIQQHIFLLNDRMYSFVQAPKTQDTPVLIDEMDMLLKSVRFNHTAIKERQFESKAESKGYKAGYLFGQLLGFALMGGAIWLIIRWIVSKSKKQNDDKDKYKYNI